MKRNNALGLGEVIDDPRGSFASTPPVSMFDRWVARKLLELVGSPQFGLTLWNGEEIRLGPRSPAVKLMFRDHRALYQLVRDPWLAFGDLYSVGRVEVMGDLLRGLEIVYAMEPRTPAARWLMQAHAWVNRAPRTNTLAGSKKHIHHHYDIGNEFYQLWLDPEMQYTCAYFPDRALTLEQAQFAKMEHVCRKLRLRPGDRVVEAGCGWGGLARHMARHHGVRVRAFNISHAQVVYARERARAEDLSRRIEYVEDDYRNISGEYDAFVSVGMLEHVGRENYPALGDLIDRVLTPAGRGLIHTIGRNQPGLVNAWIEQRIFPGAYAPTLRDMMTIFEPRRFSVLDVENLRLHYARTLECWLTRFDARADRIESMYDATFVRAWRLYLAGSLVSFTMGSLQLFQVGFARARNNDLPWSRAHLYQ